MLYKYLKKYQAEMKNYWCLVLRCVFSRSWKELTCIMNWIIFPQNLMFPAIHVEVRLSELWLWLSVWVSPWNSALAIHSIHLGSQDNQKQLVVSDWFLVPDWFLVSGCWCIPCPASFQAISSSILLYFLLKWKIQKRIIELPFISSHFNFP